MVRFENNMHAQLELMSHQARILDDVYVSTNLRQQGVSISWHCPTAGESVDLIPFWRSKGSEAW